MSANFTEQLSYPQRIFVCFMHADTCTDDFHHHYTIILCTSLVINSKSSPSANLCSCGTDDMNYPNNNDYNDRLSTWTTEAR